MQNTIKKQFLLQKRQKNKTLALVKKQTSAQSIFHKLDTKIHPNGPNKQIKFTKHTHPVSQI